MNKQFFPIPEGCKAVTVEQVGNQIITTFEPVFKRGDVLISNQRTATVCVFDKIIDNDCVVEVVGVINGTITYQSDYRYFDNVLNLRHATPEEAQLLWDALAKEGKRWNPETMQVEEIKKERWRAEQGENYYFINPSICTLKTYDSQLSIDDIMYKKGNYFQTGEQAQRAVNRLQAELDKFWEDELI